MDVFTRGDAMEWPAGIDLGIVVRHDSCHEIGEHEEPPVMKLEQLTRDDRGVFICPSCFHKVTLRVGFVVGPAR